MCETADNLGLATASVEPGVAAAADDLLVQRARDGDEGAFEQLFYRHRARVVQIASRFFNRPERSDEIVQETFAKVYFALGGYTAERGSSFAAWLSRVAINACYDELRKMRRRPEAALGEVSDGEKLWLSEWLRSGSDRTDAESSVIRRDLAHKLLARLAPDDRLVLTLLDAENVPVVEIGRITGWSVSKVKVRAHRARAALRRVLGEFL